MGGYLAAASLMHGWIPVTVQAVTIVALVRAIGWRSRGWRIVWMPLTAVCGLSTAVLSHWWLTNLGVADEPAPVRLWVWVALSGLAVTAVVVGWRSARWAGRNLSVFAASFCLLSTGLTINGWIGYFPTVSTAWNQLTAARLPDQTDWPGVRAMQHRAVAPSSGALLAVSISAQASKFPHRRELVYLPPVWFTSSPPPTLPAVMMIGGEFNTPADWVRAGDAVGTVDAFAAGHGGLSPVVVFADSGGSFGNDTECVNGPRGNAADHLLEDVIPYVDATFGARVAGWGVAGFSSGGTCAIDLAVMHPEIFGAFVDIAGDERPNAGTRSQTIDRLFGGDVSAWSTYDPTIAIARHGTYAKLAGLFIEPDTTAGQPHGQAVQAHNRGAGAERLCGLGRTRSIACGLVVLRGHHDWPFAATAFATTLPWLAAQLGIAGAPQSRSPQPGG